jgi:hypothetical protein
MQPNSCVTDKFSIVVSTKSRPNAAKPWIALATMVIPLSSAASAQGSTTYDSPRKRGDFPRQLKPAIEKPKIPLTGSAPSASKRRGNLLPNPKAQLFHQTTALERPTKQTNESIQDRKGMNLPPRTTPKSTSKTRTKSAATVLYKTGNPPKQSPKLNSSKGSSRISESGSSKSSFRITPPASSNISTTASTLASSKLIMNSAAPKRTKASNGPNANRKTFHVRLSLGYLTGIKMEQLKTRKGGCNNQLVVGYAAMAKSKKQIALSQPLIPNFQEGSSSKPLKLFWSKSRSGRDPESTNRERKLQFSIQLEHEGAAPILDDDQSMASLPYYSPEVAKIIVGLKCGDEMLPIGVANIVLHGQDTCGAKAHLAVRPISEFSEFEAPKQRSSRFGLFGGNKKQTTHSFANDEYSYSIAANATLRVKLDVKSAFPGENKSNLWGEANDDDTFATGITTLNSLDRNFGPTTSSPVKTNAINAKSRASPATRLSHSEGIVDAPNDIAIGDPHRGIHRRTDSFSLDKSFLSEWIEVLPALNSTTILSSPSEGLEMARRLARNLVPGAPSRKFPIRYIAFKQRSDEQSLDSGLTQPSFLQSSCLPIHWCVDQERAQLFVDSNTSNEECLELSSLGDDLSDIADPDKSTEQRSVPEDLQTAGSRDGSANDGETRTGISLELSQGESRDDRFANSSVTPKIIGEPMRSMSDERVDDETCGDDTEGETIDHTIDQTIDHTIDTFTDLRSAQETLLRYANKVGVNMEDLLGGMEGRKKAK